MSQLNVDDIYNNAGAGGVNLPAGVTVSGISTVASVDLVLQGSASGITSAYWDASDSSFKFNDNCRLKLGDGTDLQLVHDGNNSFIHDNGTGDLIIKGTAVDFHNQAGTTVFQIDTSGVSTATTRFDVGSTIQAEAASGIVTATAFIPTAGQLSNRNLIINGAMQVAQRGTTSTSSGYETIDRFQLNYSGHDEALTQAQHALTSSDTGPWEEGFRSSYHFTNGNQTGGAGAADYVQPEYIIEAQDLANSGWDYTSASSYISFSFWIRASVANNYTFSMTTNDSPSYRYPMETGAISANTWTKITKKIPGNSNLVINYDNGIGIQIFWYPFLGTNYTSTATANAWAAAAGTNYGTQNTTTWWTTDDATFEMTGVQLEVGEAATPFEHRSYGDELARCQRYFYKWVSGDDKYMVSGGYYSTGLFASCYTFPTTMRTTPTLDYDTGTDYWKIYSNGGADTVNAISAVRTHENGGGFDITDGTSGTLNAAGFLATNNASSSLAFTAEL